MPRAGLSSTTVIAEGARVADEIGYDKLTLAAVATRCGVALPSLYKHVDGLPGLQQGLATLAVAELGQALSAAAVGKAAAAAVDALAKAYRAYAHRYPGRYAATVRAPDPANAEHVAASNGVLRVVLAVLNGYGLPEGDAIHAARFLRSSLHGFITLEAGGGFGLPQDVGSSSCWCSPSVGEMRSFVAGKAGSSGVSLGAKRNGAFALTLGDRLTVLSCAVDERRDLLAFLQELEPHEWDSPTLCSEWRVRDLVAHMASYAGLPAGGLAGRFVQGRLTLAGANRAGVERLRPRTPGQLLTLFEQNLTPSGPLALFGGRIALTDTLIHHQDIRRPLGKAREVPLERLRHAVSFALFAPPIRGAWRLRGVRVIATDIDWSYGVGPEVRGAGEAVLMTMAGRRGAAADLEGPGATRLLQRVG